MRDDPLDKLIVLNTAALGHYEHVNIDNFCRGENIDLVTFNRVSEHPEKRSPSDPAYTVAQVMEELDERLRIQRPSKDNSRVVVVIAVGRKGTEFIPTCCSMLIARIREWCKLATLCCFVVDSNGHFYEILALATHNTTTYRFSDTNKKVDVKIERRRCRDGSFQGWTVGPWLNFIAKYDLSEYEDSSADKQPECSTEEEEHDYSLLMAHHLLT